MRLDVSGVINLGAVTTKDGLVYLGAVTTKDGLAC